MQVAIKSIHEKYRVKRVIVSIYQAVSGTGHAGFDELQKQTLSCA
ncbi:Asd/ArgC dimerization domain-containing protein [Deltaproteobacteria bacterium]|nr:Asd/ArgC dimerization domain-containing protein [Deltaproteobacteria bacterium]